MYKIYFKLKTSFLLSTILTFLNPTAKCITFFVPNVHQIVMQNINAQFLLYYFELFCKPISPRVWSITTYCSTCILHKAYIVPTLHNLYLLEEWTQNELIFRSPPPKKNDKPKYVQNNFISLILVKKYPIFLKKKFHQNYSIKLFFLFSEFNQRCSSSKEKF